jgi:hypothetical protein
LFEALLGAGPTLAPRLLVAFGEQRHSSIAHKIFKSTQVLRQLQREAVHWRWQCPTFLQQTFVEWAAQTDNQSFSHSGQARSIASNVTKDAPIKPLCALWLTYA